MWDVAQAELRGGRVAASCGRAYKRAVQGVVWHPSNRWVFLSVGHGGFLKFWDIRDPFLPLHTHMAGGGWVVDVKWLGGSYPYVVFSSDDHTIRHLDLADLSSKIFRYHTANVWVSSLKPSPFLCLGNEFTILLPQ